MATARTASKRLPRRRSWMAAMAFLMALMLLVACGRKTLPKPPEETTAPPRVTDLAGAVEADTLVLSWTVPRPQGARQLPAAAFRVLAYRQGRAEPCPNCPPNYRTVGELKVLGRPGKVAGRAKMVYRLPIEKGYRYTVAVVALAADGTSGARSNTVEFEH